MIAALNMLARLVKREVTIIRLDKNRDGIFGKLLVDNKVFAQTLEHPDVKIQSGHYLCKKIESPKFGSVYEITEVEDRTHILIHPGNLKDDTSGCVVLGMKRGDLGGRGAVLDSRKAVNKFHEEMDDNDFLISIYDLTGRIDG